MAEFSAGCGAGAGQPSMAAVQAGILAVVGGTLEQKHTHSDKDWSRTRLSSDNTSAWTREKLRWRAQQAARVFS